MGRKYLTQRRKGRQGGLGLGVEPRHVLAIFARGLHCGETMRVEAWNPNIMDETFEHVAIERLVEAAEVVANAARQKCPVGTVSRPIYKRGPYAGQAWTARDAGQLKRSIRVVRKKTKTGKAFSRKREVRVYAGHYLAYYARIVEFSRPFMRPALEGSILAIRSIVINGAGSTGAGSGKSAPPMARSTPRTSRKISGSKTWKQFTGERMGPLMKTLGSHGAAMKQIGKEWKAFKASRGA